MPHRKEKHYLDRQGWLRASVLGANDGIVSTASLILGMVAAEGSAQQVLVAGIAGLVAGALSMAAGEYVSVSSQADIETADVKRERWELKQFPESELAELTEIYQQRGLSPNLAAQVAKELSDHDALGAHLRDELGMAEHLAARPFQAAWSSALSFAGGAALPLLAAVAAPEPRLGFAVTLVALVALATTGTLAAAVGGAPRWRGALRVSIGGAAAMVLTYGVGSVVGIAV